MKLCYEDICNTKVKVLAYITNCVAVKSHGLSKTIARCFPHSVVYEKRTPVQNRKNLATPECRPTPGTIEIFEGDVTVICMHAIYLYGHLGEYPGPKDFTDNAENRLMWFRECLDKIGTYFENKTEREIAMPYKIWCGLAGGDWQKYGDALTEFEEKYNVNVSLYKL